MRVASLAVILFLLPSLALAATLGNTTVEATTASLEGVIRGGIYKATQYGTPESLTVYLDFDSLPSRSTLGYQTVGSNTVMLSSENRVTGGCFKATENGTLDSLTPYINWESGGGTDPSIRMAVYQWRGNGVNATLVDTSAAVLIDDETQADGWYGMKMLNGGQIYIDSTYFFCLWSTSGLYVISLVTDSGASFANDTSLYDSRTYSGATWESPLTPPVTTLYTRNRTSIYATFLRSRTDSLRVGMGLYAWWGSGNNAILNDSSLTRQTFGYNTADGWYSFPVTDYYGIGLDSFYVIAAWANSLPGCDLYIRYNNASTGDTLAHKTVTYGAWPAPLSGTTLINSARMSVYATYSPSVPLEDPTTCFYVNDTLFTGATNGTIEGIIRGLKLTTTQNSNVHSLTAFIATGSGNGTAKVKGAIYKESDSSWVDSTYQKTIYGANPDSTHYFEFVNKNAIVTGTVYWLCFWAEPSASIIVSLRSKDNGGPGIISNSQTYAAWPSVFPDPSNRTGGYNFSVKLYICGGATGCSCVAAGISGRRRHMLMGSLWRDLPWPIWKQAEGCFAGVSNEDNY